jgi:hypothetical protein
VKTVDLVTEIYLNEPNLEGELDLGDFSYNSIAIFISHLVDETKLVFKNQSENAKFIKLDQAQTWLKSQEEYNTKEKRQRIKELRIMHSENSLDLSDFNNLKELELSYNRLTTLNLINCSQLEKIFCQNNLLTKLILPENLTSLKELNLNDNNMVEQDLVFLVKAVNLEKL